MKRRISWFRKVYFPGLISLVCLPLFCIAKIIYPRYFEKLTAIHVAHLNDKEFGRDIFKSARSRLPQKIADDSLGSDKRHNNTVFTKLREKAIHYESTGDTVTAYRVTFTNKSKYEDVVDVLDILQSKSLGYFWLNNKIEVYKIKPYIIKTSPSAASPVGILEHDAIPIIFTCGTHSDGEYIPFFSMQNFKNLLNSVLKFATRFLLPSVFLLLMLISAIIKKRKHADSMH